MMHSALTRSSQYVFIAIALIIASSISQPERGNAADRPNVLLICIDDLKPALGCYGDALAQSPNINRLAARGVLFERAYCNQAVCSPSRNALLTSLRSQTLGIYDLPTNFRVSRPDAITLPQYFKNHGYRTEAMGKIFHVGHGNFEDVASWTVPHWRPKAKSYANVENDAKADAKQANSDARGKAYESADVPDNTYADGMLAEEAVRRLKAAKKTGEPFFMAVGFLKPHLPFIAPKKYWDLYNPKQLPIASIQAPPTNAPDFAPQFGGELRQYRDIPKQGTLPEELQRTLIHGYYAAMSYTDAQIGHVLDGLRETGLEDNTIVVLWGDHGWHLGDHGMWCKHTNYEQATRIPLIVSAPNALKGQRTTQLAESVDVYPTLCELAGLPAPSNVEGRSFAATLQDTKVATKDFVVHVYPRSSPTAGAVIGRAIRTERYRLVEWKKPGADASTAEIELYDYQADPLETKNLASENPNMVAQLRSQLAKLPEAKPQIVSATTKSNGNAGKSKNKTDRDTLFERKDSDNDQFLTRDEFMKNQADQADAATRFQRFDLNTDGKISREEFIKMGKP